VYVALAPDGPYRLACATAATTFEYTSGLGGISYYFRVTAVDASGDESDFVQAGPAHATWAESPHVVMSAQSTTCYKCHSVHAASSGMIFRAELATDAPFATAACIGCHDGRVASAANISSGTVDSFSLRSGHSLDASPSLTQSCSSCHETHAVSATSPMLPGRLVNGIVVTGAGPQWCEACHDSKDSWFGKDYPAVSKPSRNASGYPVSGTWPGPAAYADSTNSHRLIPETIQTADAGAKIRRSEGDCLYCHAAHGSANRFDSLVATFGPSAGVSFEPSSTSDGDYAALCFTCHGGTVPSGFATAPVDVKRFVTASNATGGHRVITPGGILPVGAPVPCYECHGPHGSTRGNDSMISDVLGGSLSTTGSPQAVREFCFTCHTTSDTAAGWNSDSDPATCTPVADGDKVLGIPRNGGVLKLPATIYAHEQNDTTSCYNCHGSDYGTGGNNVHDPDPGSYDAKTHTATLAGGDFTILGTDFGTHACSECHPSAELGVIHANGCSTCHPTLVAAATPWNKTCVTAGCHTAGSTAPMHSAVDTAHVFGGQTCSLQGCHSGGNSVAAVHAKEGCAICHAPGKTPSTDCTSCHNINAPHGDMSSIHAATMGSGAVQVFTGGHGSPPAPRTVSANCTICHGNSDLVSLHAGDCSVCHATGGPKSSFITWNRSCQQGGCHPSIHLYVDPPHTAAADDDCNTCHVNGNTATSASCLACHSNAPDVTAPMTLLVWSPGAYVGGNASFVGTATVGFSATDNMGPSAVRATYYRLDGAATQTVSGTFDVPQPASGAVYHTLAYWSEDWSQNAETTKTVTFRVAHKN